MTVIMWPLPEPTCVSFTCSLALAVQTCTMPERHEQLKNIFCITLHICMSSSTALNYMFCTSAATAFGLQIVLCTQPTSVIQQSLAKIVCCVACSVCRQETMHDNNQPGMHVTPLGLYQTVVIWKWTDFQVCVQVTATVLCSDGAVAASSVALNAVSAALMCSDIPWEGPLAAVQIAHSASGGDAGQTTIQPTSEQLLGCGLSGLYVGTADTALLADFQVAFLDVFHFISFHFISFHFISFHFIL